MDDNYTEYEKDIIIVNLYNFVSEIIESRYNNGYFKNKEELIEWWVNMGFHRKNVESLCKGIDE